MRMKATRKAVGMTQQELSDASGVSRETIAKIEIGEIKQPREIESLARALHSSPAWLQFGAGAVDALSKEVLNAALALQAMPTPQRQALVATIMALNKAAK